MKARVNAKWQKFITLETGHTFWIDEDSRLMCVSDQSIRDATNPASTDDGLLVLDTSRPMIVRLEGVTIPVWSPSDPDRQLSTSESIHNIEKLVVIAGRCGMLIEMRGDLIAVVRALSSMPTMTSEERKRFELQR